tara:strand:+ start:2660 stop:2908 length:249 start_codon:yes stop_codon:yes gene_type:complete
MSKNKQSSINWNGHAYKNYLNNYTEDLPYRVAYFDKEVKLRPYTLEEFIATIKSNEQFAKTWGELGYTNDIEKNKSQTNEQQ